MEKITNRHRTALKQGLQHGIDQTQMMFGRALQSVGKPRLQSLEEYGEEVVAHNETELQDMLHHHTLADVSGIGRAYYVETLGQGITTLLPTAVGAGVAAVSAQPLVLA